MNIFIHKVFYHNYVVSHLPRWVIDFITHKSENIILDAPTLIESGAYKLCDKIVSVLADAEVRKERIIVRDNLSLSEAEKRMSAQKDDAFYKEYSDAVIYNNNDKSQTLVSVERIFSEIGVL
jgi:dephospho-CoA kinase